MRWRALLVGLAAGCGQPPRPVRTYAVAELPVTEWTAGLPVVGAGTLAVAIVPPAPSDWAAARGYAELRCDGCTLGDDRTPLTLTDSPDDRVPFGHLTFDTVRARADLADGRVHVTVQLRSAELEVDAVVDGVLTPRSADTRLDGCVRVRVTDALARRDPKLYALVASLGAAAPDDGAYEVALGGTLGEVRRVGGRCAGT